MRAGWRKVVVLAALLAMLSLMLAGCAPSSEARREQVRRIVTDNYDALAADVGAWNFTRSRQIEGIESVYAEPDGMHVEYACDGAGFGPSTAYWGFYYSGDDDMTWIWCAGKPLASDGAGYRYRQPDGDNTYYTEWIAGHFYYYEAAY